MLRSFPRLLAVPFWLSISACLLSPIRSWLTYYDEGIALLNAARLLSGEIPYRDFWMLYPPGQISSLALLFAIFGKGVLIERLFDTCIRLGLVILSFRAVRRFAPPSLSAAVAVGVTLLLATVGFYGYAVFPSLLLALLALVLFQKFIDTKSLNWLIFTGVVLGVCAFCNYSA